MTAPRPLRTRAAGAATILTVLALIVVGAIPAGAQSPASTVPDVGERTTNAAGTPPSSAGNLIFFVLVAVIAGGAAILYFRHRPPRPS